ncbi:MAG TPA: group II intron reverse transcriptase/maturase, partial [Puia sp.]|nr:group II intron reverse transcriptase/maturase [Puia sp.]
MLEEILDYRNITNALRQVTANRGAGGVDGMGVEALREWLEKNWHGLKQIVLEGSYRPQPVRKVEIPKPN